MNDLLKKFIVLLSVCLIVGLFIYLNKLQSENDNLASESYYEEVEEKEEEKEEIEKFEFKEIEDTFDKALYMMSIFYTYDSVKEYVVNENDSDYQELKFNLDDLKEYLYTLFDSDYVDSLINESLKSEFKVEGNKLYINKGFIPTYDYKLGYDGKYEKEELENKIVYKVHFIIEDDMNPCDKEYTYELENGKFKEFKLPVKVCYE